MNRRGLLGRLLPALVLLVGCHAGPPVIHLGEDDCDFCRMTITDPRFGGAAITAAGRTVRFDAVECLANWTAAQADPPRALWVSDAAHPGALIPVAEARFYRVPGGRSPMGRGVIAIARSADPAALGALHEGAPLDWDAVRALVASEAVADPARGGGQ